MKKSKKIIITGAAGLVGQNLIITLKNNGYNNIVAIDKHSKNIEILKNMHKDINIIESDLAESGIWVNSFEGADIVIMLHAQIGGLTIEPFIRNNIIATKNVIDAMKKYQINYLIHISSSVVNSVADDFYTNTKKEQEKLVIECGIDYCMLRPTLMFGWFDRKHLGWLSRFMEKVPIFPIPGNGKYIRQPLYVIDFCNIITSAMEKKPENKIYNITGKEQIYYIDIIKTIKKIKNSKTLIIKIPYFLFYFILFAYSLFDSNPPFTTQQLKALVAHDIFELIPWWNIFDVESTPLEVAMEETFNHPIYSKIVLEF